MAVRRRVATGVLASSDRREAGRATSQSSQSSLLDKRTRASQVDSVRDRYPKRLLIESVVSSGQTVQSSTGQDASATLPRQLTRFAGRPFSKTPADPIGHRFRPQRAIRHGPRRQCHPAGCSQLVQGLVDLVAELQPDRFKTN